MPQKTFSPEEKDSFLQRIAYHLILNASIVPNPGLYHGKMGIVLFLYHYSRYSGKPNCEEFAGELLNEICNEIHDGIEIDFADGLCGIGWGIEYLLDYQFLVGDSLKILSEIDTRIMERDLLRVHDRSVETGLTGIGYYIHKHLHSPHKDPDKSPFDNVYLSNWHTVAGRLFIPGDTEILLNIIKSPPFDPLIKNWNPGLEKGCAGYGLKEILI